MHWMETADRECDPAGWLLGEDDYGDLCVPGRDPDGPWRRFNRWNPLHWLAYWNSYRRNELVWLERHPDPH